MMATELYTAPDIARLLGVRRPRVNYAIESRKIEPQYVLGKVRAFNAAGLEAIREAVAECRWEARKRELIRRWMQPGEEAEYDHPDTPAERVAEIVLEAQRRLRQACDALVESEGLTEEEARRRMKRAWYDQLKSERRPR